MDLVVITGAGSGLGKALTRRFLREGFEVVALDVDSEALTKLRSDLSKSEDSAGKLFTDRVDVTNEVALLELARKIKAEHQAPFVWINNAGRAQLGDFSSVSSNEFRSIMDVNFFGVLYGMRAALSVMSEPTRGVIVNVASLNGQIPAPFMTSYVASKHAVVGLTRSFQLELEQTQSPLKTLLVLPGFFQSEMIRPRNGFRLPQWLQRRVSNPDDVAAEIVMAIRSNTTEIFPTLHGKFLLQAFRWAPWLTSRSSRLLVARNWKQLLGLDPIETKEVKGSKADQNDQNY